MTARCSWLVLLALLACGDDDSDGAQDGAVAMDGATSDDGSTSPDTSTPGCRADETECGSACVSTDSNPSHCGGCDVECSGSEVCSMGMCSSDCSSGTEPCDRACVDTQTDSRHCGGCGNACSGAQACEAAECVTPPPPCDATLCGELCVETDFDERHCGGCDNACDSTQICVGGSCRAHGAAPAEICVPPISREDVSSPTTTVGTGTPESCTHEALASAVATGGVIVFDCGDGPAIIDITEVLQVPNDRDTIIDGAGVVTLDAGYRSRIFEFYSDNYRVNTNRLVLQGLTLQRGQAPATDFTPRNTGNPQCAWGYKDGEGGAIYVRDGRLHIIDCVFCNNHAATPGPDTGGGAIFAGGALEVIAVGSAFVGNDGSNGGAIGLLQSDGIFYNTLFEANTASGRGKNFGGATGCPNFNHGEQGGAGGNSGAVGIDGDSVETVDFCGTTFRDNRSNELGTVSRTPNAHRGISTFDRCLFEGNFAGDGGGAVWMQDMQLEMTASALIGNTSDGLGGGIRIDQGPHGSTILIENTTFQGNRVNDNLGGGLVFAGEGLVRNCTFAENEAAGGKGYFGAALVSHGPESQSLQIRNSIFWNNIDDHQWTPMTCSVGNPGEPVPLPGDNNVQWPMLRNGSNMVEDNLCTTGTSFGDASLSAPADNGGPTPTMLPGSSSPALGIGTDCPDTDQRGQPRPTNGCAAGAVQP